MSFVLHDYPGMPSVCALCGKGDCSKAGEPWIHLTTIEDVPCIGVNCLRLMADNVGLTTQVVEREVVRPPTEEEIVRLFVQLVPQQRLTEVLNHDSSVVSQFANEHHTGDTSGSSEHPTQAGAPGSDEPTTGRKPRTVRSGQTRPRARRK